MIICLHKPCAPGFEHKHSIIVVCHFPCPHLVHQITKSNVYGHLTFNHGVRDAWFDLISALQPLIQKQIASLSGSDEISEYFKINSIVLFFCTFCFACGLLFLLVGVCLCVWLWYFIIVNHCLFCSCLIVLLCYSLVVFLPCLAVCQAVLFYVPVWFHFVSLFCFVCTSPSTKRTMNSNKTINQTCKETSKQKTKSQTHKQTNKQPMRHKLEVQSGKHWLTPQQPNQSSKPLIV